MSKSTAISRTKLSRPTIWLRDNFKLYGRCLDYGCGRGFDAVNLGLEAYDPYWGDEMPSGSFDTIICIYVLNVVTEELQQSVIKDIENHLSPGGLAYFAVRRDIAKDSPGRGCTERVVHLTDLDSIKKTSNFEIYELRKGS